MRCTAWAKKPCLKISVPAFHSVIVGGTFAVRIWSISRCSTSDCAALTSAHSHSCRGLWRKLMDRPSHQPGESGYVRPAQLNLVHLTSLDEVEGAVPGALRVTLDLGAVGPRRDVGDEQPADARLGGDGSGLGAGEVEVRRVHLRL